MLHGASDIIVALSDLMKPRSPKTRKMWAFCIMFILLYSYSGFFVILCIARLGPFQGC